MEENEKKNRIVKKIKKLVIDKTYFKMLILHTKPLSNFLNVFCTRIFHVIYKFQSAL